MTGFSNEVRQLIRDRAGFENGYIVCEVQAACQGRAVAAYDLHHRRNRGAGGSKRPDTNLPGNSLAACRDCHRLITEHPAMALKNGWLVRQNQTPCEVPVLRRRVWVLLDNDGGVTPASCVCGEISAGGRVSVPCICVEER